MAPSARSECHSPPPSGTPMGWAARGSCDEKDGIRNERDPCRSRGGRHRGGLGVPRRVGGRAARRARRRRGRAVGRARGALWPRGGLVGGPEGLLARLEGVPLARPGGARRVRPRHRGSLRLRGGLAALDGRPLGRQGHTRAGRVGRAELEGDAGPEGRGGRRPRRGRARGDRRTGTPSPTPSSSAAPSPGGRGRPTPRARTGSPTWRA